MVISNNMLKKNLNIATIDKELFKISVCKWQQNYNSKNRMQNKVSMAWFKFQKP